MTLTRQIRLASRPEGELRPDDFAEHELRLPEPQFGEVLVKVLYLSVDPYMRGRMGAAKSYIEPYRLGKPLIGGMIAQVLHSNSDDLKPDDVVIGYGPWAEHAILRAKTLQKLPQGDVPMTAWLGILGMPGMTAWTALTRILQAKAGQTILIPAATGAVGSLACQLAKEMGLHVIALTGGADKAALALGYGAEQAIDHHATPSAGALTQALMQAAPQGIDLYLESVGGKVLEATLPCLNDHAQIALCGMMAWYDSPDASALPLPSVWRHILTRKLRLEGFMVLDHWAHYPEFVAQTLPKVEAGTLQWQESVAEGLQSAPLALMGLWHGANRGKQLVRVAPEVKKR